MCTLQSLSSSTCTPLCFWVFLLRHSDLRPVDIKGVTNSSGARGNDTNCLKDPSVGIHVRYIDDDLDVQALILTWDHAWVSRILE